MDMFIAVCTKVFSAIYAAVSALPFSTATWFVLAVVAAVAWIFYKADQDPTSAVHWEHLVISSETGRACPYKLGYFIGMIVSTWIVVYLVDTHKKIDFDTLGLYLAYLLGATGWSSYLKTTKDSNSTKEQREEQREALKEEQEKKENE